MGLFQSDEYVEKPINYAAFAESARANESKTIIPVNISFQPIPQPLNSTTSKYRGQVVGNGTTQYFYAVPLGKKLILTHLNAITFLTGGVVNLAGDIRILDPEFSTATPMEVMALNAAYSAIGNLLDNKQLINSQPLIFVANTSFGCNLPANSAANITLMGYLINA